MSPPTSGAAYRPATATCDMCGKAVERGARFCDRCFDIIVAHDDPADAGGEDPP